MRLLLAAITLSLAMTADGLLFIVQSDSPTTVYIQLDTQDGATVQDAIIYQVELGAGEGFGRTVHVQGPGSVRVRVWDGSAAPSADQAIALPARHTYLPLVHGP